MAKIGSGIEEATVKPWEPVGPVTPWDPNCPGCLSGFGPVDPGDPTIAVAYPLERERARAE